MAMANAQAAMTQNCGPLPGACVPPAMRTKVMMPMVFWASLVPCARATRLEVKICPVRKPPRFCVSLSPVSGSCREVKAYARRVQMYATRPAMSGAKIAGRMTF